MQKNQDSLNSIEVDLDTLEHYAERFFELSTLGDESNIQSRREMNESLLPFFELASACKLPALFSLAVSSKKINLAALCCSPPEIGISFPNTSTGSLFSKLDQQNFVGHSLRHLNKHIPDTKAHPAAIKALASEILKAYEGVNFDSTLQRNTLYILCEYIVNRFPEEKISARLFCEIYRQAEVLGLTQSSLITTASEVMFQTHFDNGNLYHNTKLFAFMEELFDKENNKILVRNSLCSAIGKLEQDNDARFTVGKIADMMVDSDRGLDGVRLAVAKHIDQNYALADILNASLELIDTLLPKSDIRRVESILAESAGGDLDHFSTLINDPKVYKRIAGIEGFDVSKLNLSKIGLQARGAALEEELGI